MKALVRWLRRLRVSLMASSFGVLSKVIPPLPLEAVSQYEKAHFLNRGGGGRVEKISSGNLYPFETRRPKHMKAFDFPQEMISHTIRDPHSKALEPDCLCPWAGNYDTASWGRGFSLLFHILKNRFSPKLLTISGRETRSNGPPVQT